jgi:hypothetical protein
MICAEPQFGICGAGVAEIVIMKITGHRTRSVFERYNITDHTDTLEAGLKAGEFLACATWDFGYKTYRQDG